MVLDDRITSSELTLISISSSCYTDSVPVCAFTVCSQRPKSFIYNFKGIQIILLYYKVKYFHLFLVKALVDKITPGDFKNYNK
jgi:hypothetical protein